ncbi:ligase-associated DNA damage response DEXH box helicase [Algoriphagus aestuariicola]|uniref:Ligase-associated DNA damage response DEXH box helicase n=1 Tax=Algoriphagus aestuariicola TaxID=1852016 RepID=A0ABS3BNP3_9BACT|nr:ligase-associated DNA damage response DEXH box helicase [Algoriphagus aestuariicola]MBN7800919.1 ligase-associated DNA damage response DEXH box helicase [Algoriphagus aestuariicola]
MEDHRLAVGLEYFRKKGWSPFPFQLETWRDFLDGKSGILNAPTGSGKTFALWFPAILEFIQAHPDSWQRTKNNGIQLIWVTPLRALAQDIQKAMQEVCDHIGLPWQVAVRNGDTDAKTRAAMNRRPPECLITTPETLHMLLSQKDHQQLFQSVKAVVVDEWHELVGNKRGVQMQLALEYIQAICPATFRRWAISATIGNLEEAAKALLGESLPVHLIKAKVEKEIILHSVFPDEIEKYPWSGHLGIRMMDKVIPVIEAGRTVLMFTNTRSQTEIWYQKILNERPDWAGWIAMHHGSLDNSVRAWVENSLHEGKLKLVVCTSSLDLGVDFRPVDRVIQVGSPKGVSRFIQRAGRAGHQPGLPSEIFFVPTNSLELIEAAALRDAIDKEETESQFPPQLPYDVLIQFLVTLAVGSGFDPKFVFQVAKRTLSFRTLTSEEMDWMMDFITKGGNSLGSYEDFLKVVSDEDGLFRVKNKRIAMKHRLSMGTIVSDPMLKVRLKNGTYLGTVEEYFIAKMKIGDRFFFAGRSLELVQIKDMSAIVRLSEKKTNNVVSWSGARMSLSSKLADKIREIFQDFNSGIVNSEEVRRVLPVLDLQKRLSLVPDRNTFLIEAHQSEEGFHLFFYPFEGRMIHELMSALIAYRISQSIPVSFNMAMNDYGFELLSDVYVAPEEVMEVDIFSLKNIERDILHCVNASEMSRRKFREIASIAGLVFQGYPGKPTTFKHIQANSSLLFQVFEQYDPDNLLLKQAREESLNQQMEQEKFIRAMKKVSESKIVILHPVQFTPFSFPLMVDRLSRSNISSETVEDKVVKILAQMTAD